MSLMIRSGSDSATRTIASEPRRAVTTSYPSARSVSDTASKRPGSSSTTRSCLVIAILIHRLLASAIPPKRQVQRKYASAADFAFHADPATHVLHHVASQIETHSDYC